MSTLANKIQEVFNEPGCAKNQAKSEKERKKGCAKQLQPGGAAGGCAFDGAKIALQPITDVAHLVHGPIACEGSSWDNRNSSSSGSKLYRTSFTTDLSETDIIFGGEKRLYRVDPRNHGEIRPAGGLRLPDLRAGHDRRRHQRGLQEGEREVRQALHSGSRAGFRWAPKPSATSSLAKRCSITSSARKSRITPRPTTSTSSANTMSRASCGR